MDSTILIGGGVAAIAILPLAGWAIARARRPRRIASPEEAAAAADTLPGFATAGAVVGADGMAALAVDGAGRVAVLARRGKRVTAREIAWAAVHAVPQGMAIDTGDRTLGRVTVTGIDHLDVRRLAPVLSQR